MLFVFSLGVAQSWKLRCPFGAKNWFIRFEGTSLGFLPYLSRPSTWPDKSLPTGFHAICAP